MKQYQWNLDETFLPLQQIFSLLNHKTQKETKSKLQWFIFYGLVSFYHLGTKYLKSKRPKEEKRVLDFLVSKESKPTLSCKFHSFTLRSAAVYSLLGFYIWVSFTTIYSLTGPFPVWGALPVTPTPTEAVILKANVWRGRADRHFPKNDSAVHVWADIRPEQPDLSALCVIKKNWCESQVSGSKFLIESLKWNGSESISSSSSSSSNASRLMSSL